jgi:predicted nucleic acid-binding Zn ribbon protein
MMNEDQQLRDAVKWQRKPDPDRAVRLGDVTRELMKNRISPQQARFGSIPEIWNQLLPEELRRHCKITGISSGQLKVLVDLPAYKYELQLCSSELLSELQQQCPRAHIKKIKFVVGSESRV